MRVIYKDIDHGNLSVHHGTATVSFTSKEKNSQQPQREVDCAIVSGAYFLWIYDITVCECGSSCSSFLRHTHHLPSQKRSQWWSPHAGVPCSCWYSPTQTKHLASGSGVSDLLMVRSGARLSSVQPTPRYKIATLNNLLLAILTLLSITLCLCKTPGCRTGNLLCERTHERECSVTHHSSSAEIMAIVVLLSESTFGENKAAAAEPACLAFNTKIVAVWSRKGHCL